MRQKNPPTSSLRISCLSEERLAVYNQLIVRQKTIAESERLRLESDPDYFGRIYSFETIRQGQPEPPKQLIADVYTSEFCLHVVFLQLQGFLAQIRNSFLHRVINQISREFRYYHYEPGKFYKLYYCITCNLYDLFISDEFCGHGPNSLPCCICMQRDRCRRLRNLLQMPTCDHNNKRLFLEIFVEYLRQIFSTRTFYDCSSQLRENWLPRLFNRAKLFIFELGNQNLDIGEALNSLTELCQSVMRHFNLHMTLYSGNFNSITVNPLLDSGVEIRFHFYFTVTIGRSVSSLLDESLNHILYSRLNRGLAADPNPHLKSSFLGSPMNDF